MSENKGIEHVFGSAIDLFSEGSRPKGVETVATTMDPPGPLMDPGCPIHGWGCPPHCPVLKAAAQEMTMTPEQVLAEAEWQLDPAREEERSPHPLSPSGRHYIGDFGDAGGLVERLTEALRTTLAQLAGRR